MTLQPEATRHPKRLRVEALERYADQLAARIDGPRPGLLAVGLSRDLRAWNRELHIKLTLKTQLAVPRGLTVANEQKVSHGN